MAGRRPRTPATLEHAPAALSPVASARRAPSACIEVTSCTRFLNCKSASMFCLNRCCLQIRCGISPALSKCACSAGVRACVLGKVPPPEAAAYTRVQSTSSAHFARDPTDQGPQGHSSPATASPSGADSQPAPCLCRMRISRLFFNRQTCCCGNACPHQCDTYIVVTSTLS